MMRRLVPYQTIVEAQSGDGDAMAFILRHYDDYINYCSIRERSGKYGEKRSDVSEEVKQRIITKLIVAIVRNFVSVKSGAGL